MVNMPRSDMMLTSPELDQLATALAAAQGEMKDAEKTSVNPHLKSKYADLAEVLQTARPVLSKHGLSLVQGVSYGDRQVHVKTRLLHKSGQYIEDMISIPVPKEDAQGVGTGTSYGRRYGATAIIGMSQDDDDGESIKATAAKKPASTASANPGSQPQTQVPATSPIAQAMIAKFDTIAKGEPLTNAEAGMQRLTEEYASLTPSEQTQVLPAAKAARTRLEEAKTKQNK